MSILMEIAAKTRERIEREKKLTPMEELRKTAMIAGRLSSPFAEIFRRPGLNVIAEIKRASPSRGDIAPHLDPLLVANGYLGAGARALSILTEPYYFKGSIQYLKDIRARHPHAALLMKDFFLDEYQILQARAYGADAVLIIVAMLGEKESGRLMRAALDMGLCPLVEVHNEEELTIALKLKARLVGINNRNLNDLSLSLATTRNLLAGMPPDVTVICDSGLNSHDDLVAMRELGCHGFLIGTALMSSDDPAAALTAMLGLPATEN